LSFKIKVLFLPLVNIINAKFFFRNGLLSIILISALASCKVYRQNIILQTDEGLNTEKFEEELAKAEGSYLIQPGDQLNIEVYTNKGERVIDPNMELMEGVRGGQGQPTKVFQVFPDGNLILPMVGSVSTKNHTIKSLQEEIEEKYDAYYINPFVRVQATNQRVVVLGALGGQVIPLAQEKMNLLEVLALAGGLNDRSKGRNIRLIRGPLDDPSVQIINLSTIEGMQKANLNILPNDIIYVEPIRRVFNESVRDAAPVLGVITNVITLFIVIQSLNNSNN